MSVTPIDYTSRDYWSLRQDLIEAVKARVPDWQGDNDNDLLVAILEAFAFMGDILNYYVDRVANEAFLPTATQRQSLMNIAETYGYTPSGPIAASVSLQFTYEFDEASASITVPAGTQVRGTYDLDGEEQEVVFETIQDLTVTTGSVQDPITELYSGTAIVTAIEGETQKETGTQISGAPIGILLGTSDGSPNQEFLIDDDTVAEGSIRVWAHESLTNGREYYNVRSLDDSVRQSRVYRVRQYADGTTSVQFGDGASGYIPPAGTEIRVVYRRGGGVVGNVPLGVLDALVDDQVEASVVNVSAGTGGANAESNDSIRSNAASALRARERIVLLKDAEDLARTVPGVSLARAVGSAMTNIGVYVVPSSGSTDLSPGFVNGTETSAFTTLKSQVRQYLSERVPYGTTINVLSPTYVGLAVELSVYLPSGVRRSEARDAVGKALKDKYLLGANGLGATLYPADVYATVASIDLVRSLQLTNFQRFDTMVPGSEAVTDPIYGAANEVLYLDPSSYPVITMYGGINDIG